MKPIAYSIGVSKDIEPLYMVAVQLNILIADGTATTIVRNENTIPAYIDWPETNMWCPQTRNPNTAIAMDEKAINS